MGSTHSAGLASVDLCGGRRFFRGCVALFDHELSSLPPISTLTERTVGVSGYDGKAHDHADDGSDDCHDDGGDTTFSLRNKEKER